jgi:DNA-directed RNA polymerase specialized sigma subunit
MQLCRPHCRTWYSKVAIWSASGRRYAYVTYDQDDDEEEDEDDEDDSMDEEDEEEEEEAAELGGGRYSLRDRSRIMREVRYSPPKEELRERERWARTGPRCNPMFFC